MDLAYMAKMPAEEFITRRENLLNKINDNSVAIIFSAQEQTRNNDCTYPFRQDSYFWYLTGFNEPDSILLLIKKDGQSQVVCFLRPSDPLLETWNGHRLGVENAPKKLSIDVAYPIEKFVDVFPEITKNLTTLYYKKTQQSWGEVLFSQIKEKSVVLFSNISDLALILDEMRLFKSPNEIVLMQQAGQISALGHIRAMKEARPNRFEYELESEILYEFNRFGARYASYNSIVAAGENACILHYTENDQQIKDGDLVLIDAGCEFDMYAGDISRTFPVNGKFTLPQREIYEIVLKAQKRAIELLVPGASIQQVNDEVVRIKVEGLVRLGILSGDIDEIIESQSYRKFYMHGLGHWLGLDVHDVGSYSNSQANGDRNSHNRDRRLEKGMVLTVEPGLYISEKFDVPEQYKGIGIRIEDNILITDSGNKVLTSAVPKEIDEIEKLMSQK